MPRAAAHGVIVCSNTNPGLASMVNLLQPHRSPASAVDPLSEEALATMFRRLRQVQAWWVGRSSQHLPVAAQLRTPELEPDLEEECTLAALECALHELAEKRARLLARESSSDPTTAPSGRLLVCEINMSISTGHSQAASEGFFDLDDRPPWDSWLVGFGKTRRARPEAPVECLISWVPEPLVPVAEAGIAANSCRCLYWIGDGPDGLSAQPAGGD